MPTRVSHLGKPEPEACSSFIPLGFPNPLINVSDNSAPRVMSPSNGASISASSSRPADYMLPETPQKAPKPLRMEEVIDRSTGPGEAAPFVILVIIERELG